jgi:prophage maintenance system killer protein
MSVVVRTLTVQDILWIHFQTVGPNPVFRYADLEEATFYQFAYGPSPGLLAPAARFLRGFPRRRPFSTGNQVTGFVALGAFLGLNGYDLTVPDGQASAWYRALVAADEDPIEELRTAVTPRDDHDASLNPPVQDRIVEILARYPLAMAELRREAANR